MIKRTLCFTSPAYLSLKDGQLVIKLPEVERSNLPERMKKDSTRTIPVEDIGVVVLDNRQITLTHGLLEALLENNSAVVTCDARSMPVGLMLPLCGNTLQSERFNRQIEASLPLKKQLWQLNYGYAILRAVIARALVSAGLLPTLGIHHHNRYNAYCLADDIMEPYRPYVDLLVCNIIKERNAEEYAELTKDIKMSLLSVPTIDVTVNGRRSPLMIAATQTAASLCKCFNGELRRIAYPEI